MFEFLRKPAFNDPQLGRLTRTSTMWCSPPLDGRLYIGIEGDRVQPSRKGLEVAHALIRQPDELIQAAENFVRGDRKALEFIEGNGTLVCDGFTVHASGKFSIGFSLTDWPDAMIEVPFEAGVPREVLLGD